MFIANAGHSFWNLLAKIRNILQHFCNVNTKSYLFITKNVNAIFDTDRLIK